MRRGDSLNYSPKRCASTFPIPSRVVSLEDVALKYIDLRESVANLDGVTLTGLYNLFHDSDIMSHEIINFRNLHAELDQAIAAAYGWQDLDLGHGFHETKQGIRYTISEAARREVLDRLLAWNHQRHAEEQAEQAAQAAAAPAKRTRKQKDAGDQIAMDI